MFGLARRDEALKVSGHWRVAVAVLAAALAGCSDSDSQASDDASPSPAATPHVLVRLSDGPSDFDVVVGRTYHVREGSTDDGMALRLIMGRDGGGVFESSGQMIRDVYDSPGYAHYGNEGEESPPRCKIEEQANNSVDDSALNHGEPRTPIACTLDDGTEFFATQLRP